jgi:hypothetical protein
VDELDLVRLDRQLRTDASVWRRWRRRLPQGVTEVDDPFVRMPSVTRQTFLAVRDRPEHDPLRAPISRWLQRLLDDKANRVVITRESAARALLLHPIDVPERASLSLSAMLERALSDGPRRRAWLACFLERGGQAAELARLHAERRAEVVHRLGQGSSLESTAPCENVEELARAWLGRTDDAFSDYRSSDFAELIELGLALEASGSAPARLSADVLAGLFRGTRLFDGLRLDLGQLPPALAPASFLRALARLGAAFADAAAPRDQPFSIAHDPFGLERFTRGALFASLPLSPPFAKRALGVSGGRARDHARALARSLLIETRARALRVVLRAPAFEGARSFGIAFEELTERSFGARLGPEHAGLLLRLAADDAQRFVGWLLAASKANALTEAHDEDWFRNPRASEQLRAEAALPPAVVASPEALEAGARALADRFLLCLG